MKLFIALLLVGTILGVAQYNYKISVKQGRPYACLIPEGCCPEESVPGPLSGVEYCSAYEGYRGFPLRISNRDYQIYPQKQALLYLNGLMFAVTVPAAGMGVRFAIRKLRHKK